MSIDLEKYTDKSKAAIQKAQMIATSMGHQQIGPEHLMEAMITDHDSVILDLIALASGNTFLLKNKIREIIDKNTSIEGSGAGSSHIGKDLAAVLIKAQELSKNSQDEYVTQERLFEAMLKLKGSNISAAIIAAGITEQSLESAIVKIRGGNKAGSVDSENSYNALRKYARDLNEATQNINR